MSLSLLPCLSSRLRRGVDSALGFRAAIISSARQYALRFFAPKGRVLDSAQLLVSKGKGDSAQWFGALLVGSRGLGCSRLALVTNPRHLWTSGEDSALSFANSSRFVALDNVSVNPFFVFIPWILPMKRGDYKTCLRVFLSSHASHPILSLVSSNNLNQSTHQRLSPRIHLNTQNGSATCGLRY